MVALKRAVFAWVEFILRIRRGFFLVAWGRRRRRVRWRFFSWRVRYKWRNPGSRSPKRPWGLQIDIILNTVGVPLSRQTLIPPKLSRIFGGIRAHPYLGNVIGFSLIPPTFSEDKWRDKGTPTVYTNIWLYTNNYLKSFRLSFQILFLQMELRNDFPNVPGKFPHTGKYSNRESSRFRSDIENKPFMTSKNV